MRRLSFQDQPNKTIKLWNLKTGLCLYAFAGHSDWADALAVVGNNNNRFVSCSADCTVKLWNTTTGKCVHAFEHDGCVKSVAAFGNDTFVSGSADRKILLCKWTT